MKPQIVAVGTCCLVAVICNETLYVANLGDSRAVLCRAVKATGEVLSIKLSDEHNVCHEAVRQELFSLHPDDPQIVVLKHNVWRFKGIIQVRRPDFILNVGCVHSVLVSGLLTFIIYLILFCKILAHRYVVLRLFLALDG
ncbi:Probable protein phosphatase 2C 28 [Linum perenne]